MAEALGVRWCLQTAVQQELVNLVFFPDASTVLNCQNYNLVMSAIDPIIQDYKGLTSHLSRVVVSHVRRQLNVVAHNWWACQI